MSLSNSQPASTVDPAGLVDADKKEDTIASSSESYNLLSNPHVEDIEGQLDPHYLRTNGPQVQDLGNRLFQHTWFGFDLDNTLHEFRKASKAASHVVFEQTSKYSNVPIDELAATYVKILKRKTASAFTDGKNSDYHRQARFRALLEAHGIQVNDNDVADLALLYKDALADALEVKPGALSLLRYLRSIGKKVAVITEGPQDAQEWTLEKLGLAEYVDLLVTTNKFGKSKVDGLFGTVLDYLGIEGMDMVYIGDSFERDMLPAGREGIMTIRLSEGEDVVLGREEIKVDSLLKIEHILGLRGDKD